MTKQVAAATEAAWGSSGGFVKISPRQTVRQNLRRRSNLIGISEIQCDRPLLQCDCHVAVCARFCHMAELTTLMSSLTKIPLLKW